MKRTRSILFALATGGAFLTWFGLDGTDPVAPTASRPGASIPEAPLADSPVRASAVAEGSVARPTGPRPPQAQRSADSPDRTTRMLRQGLEDLLTRHDTRRSLQAANAVPRLLADPELNPRRKRLSPAQTRELNSLLEPLHRDLVEANLLAKAVTTESLMLAVARKQFVTIARDQQANVRALVAKHFGRPPRGEFNGHLLPASDPRKMRLVTLPKQHYPDYHASQAMVDEMRTRQRRVVRGYLASR